MKDSSPGCSLHRASLTHGWKTGHCKVRETLDSFLLLDPPGALSLSRRSGTPDIFAVNAIDPDDIAEMGLPDGARMTETFSRMST